MNKLIRFLFLKNYKTLLIISFVFLLLVTVYLIYGTLFLVNKLNDAISQGDDYVEEITYYDLSALENVKANIAPPDSQ